MNIIDDVWKTGDKDILLDDLIKWNYFKLYNYCVCVPVITFLFGKHL